MSKKANKPKGQTNSEEKSEEFLNFERGIDRMLSLPKKELERIRKEVPAPKRKTRRK